MVRRRVGAVITKSGNVLLVSDKSDFFNLPGGQVNAGEDDESALKRELDGELGVSILGSRFYHNFKHMNESLNVEQEDFVYLVAIGGDIQISQDITEYKWVSKSDFDSKNVMIRNSFVKNLYPKLLEDGLIFE